MGGDPVSPEVFSNIISDFGSSEMDVAAAENTDTSGKMAAGSDGLRKGLVRIGGQHFRDKGLGIFLRVRIRDPVS